MKYNKQKLFSLIAFLMLISISQTAMADDVEWTDVGTCQELMNALIYGKKHIKLTNNIFMHNTVESIYQSMAVSDVEITGIRDSYDKDAGEAPYWGIWYLDDYINEAGMTNVNIHHLYIYGSSHAMFASTKNCTFNELIIEKCKINDNSDNGSIISENDYKSTFKNIYIMNSGVFLDDKSAGLLVKNMESGTIEDCTAAAGCIVYAAGSTDISTSGIDIGAEAGSFVGHADKTTITNCTSFAVVVGNDDMCGGIVGYGKHCEISNCSFYGIVKQQNLSEDGWIAMFDKAIGAREKIVNMYNAYTAASTGYSIYCLGLPSTYNEWGALLCATSTSATDMANSTTIFESSIANTIIHKAAGFFVEDATTLFNLCWGLETAWTIYGWYSLGTTVWDIASGLSGHDEVGGIVGEDYGSYISYCANYGMVYSQDAYGGGIVGYGNYTEINSCLNHGVVRGGEQTGGIAGYMSHGSLNLSANLGNVGCSDTSTGGKICGETAFGCTMEYNCYSDSISELDNITNTAEVKISQNDIVSGKAALFLHNHSGKWYQKVGTDHWPNLMSKNGVVTETSENHVDESLGTTINANDKMSLTCAMINPFSDINIISDIDFEGYPNFNLSSGFMPFCGTIDGNGHKISNIIFSQTGKTFGLFGLESLWTNTKDVGMLGCARNATFRNFTLDNIWLDMATNVTNGSLFVGNSENCIYENIHITGNSIIMELDNDNHYEYNIGGLIGCSTNDTITNCSVGADCSIYASGSGVFSKTPTGGLVGKSYGSVISQCYNHAQVKLGISDNNGTGGIVGCAENGKIDRCLNAGHIIGDFYSGGILGYGKNIPITRSVNLGVLDVIYKVRKDDRGGIVGCLDGSNATLSNCINFGSVNHASTDGDSGPLEGEKLNGAYRGKNNYYYCQFNGTHADNENEYTDDSHYRYADITSGAFAYYNLDENNRKWLYQSIDNDASDIKMPVPIPDMGEVFSNILCNGTETYSNRYQSTAAHNGTDEDENGICDVCGNVLSMPAVMHVTNATQLNNAARYINTGNYTSTPIITIDNDIDMEGIAFTPIGNSAHPFTGQIVANGIRIKNLELIGNNEEGTGLLGTVGGDAIIMGIIIDKSCKVIQDNGKLGTAGLIGCVKTSDTAAHKLFIYSCGNEADVTSANGMAAGIIGEMRTNDNTVVNIGNCYNSGDISGKTGGGSGSIIGYTSTKTMINNTWNSGTISGNADGYPFANSTNGTITNCYDINTQTGVTQITNRDVQFGALWKNIQGNISSLQYLTYYRWKQDLGTDSYPTFGTGGLRYTRDMDSPWGTLILPYSVTSNDSISYYYISEIGTVDQDGKATVTLTRRETVPANRPCIFYNGKGSGTQLTIPYTNNSTFVSPTVDTYRFYPTQLAEEIEMKGVYAQTELTSGFINNTAAFWNVGNLDATKYVNAFHIYMNSDELSTAKEIDFKVDGTSSDYDVNNDGKNDAADVAALATARLGNKKTMDINNDNKYDIADVANLVNLILHPSLIITTDATPPSATNGVIYGK